MNSFFIERPIVAMVIAILMVIAGGVSMTTLPVAQFPSIVPPEISIAEGQNKAAFQITTHAVIAQTPVVITASYGGSARNANLTIIP